MTDRPPLLGIEVDRRDDYAVLTLIGELEMSSSPELRQCLEQVRELGVTRIVVDVSQLRFCDSSGLAAFVAAAMSCTGAGGWLRLAGPGDQLAAVLGIAQLFTILPTYRDVAAAVAGHDGARLAR